MMKIRGLIIFIIGITLIGISLSLAASVLPSNFDGSKDLSLASLFEGVFDKISDEVQIMPGDSIYVSYGVFSQNVSILWGIQIINFQQGDVTNFWNYYFHSWYDYFIGRSKKLSNH